MTKTPESTILSPHATNDQNGKNKMFPGNFTGKFHKYIQNVVQMSKTKNIKWQDFEKLAESLIFLAKKGIFDKNN